MMRSKHEIEIDQIHDRQLAEKDEEIERLKQKIKEQEEYGYWMRNLIDPGCHYHSDYTDFFRELITELCDALTRVRPHLAQPDLDLIQRAREATR